MFPDFSGLVATGTSVSPDFSGLFRICPDFSRLRPDISRLCRDFSRLVATGHVYVVANTYTRSGIPGASPLLPYCFPIASQDVSELFRQ